VRACLKARLVSVEYSQLFQRLGVLLFLRKRLRQQRPISFAFLLSLKYSIYAAMLVVLMSNFLISKIKEEILSIFCSHVQ
jgi:hypothetical protein